MGRANATDAELIDATRRGELGAFGTLVERYQDAVGAASLRGTRDRTLGEEVVQETFVTAWLRLDRLRDAGSLRSWLCGIARNLARRARERRDREAPTEDVVAITSRTPFDAISERETERAVNVALQHLPEPYRAPIAMYYCDQRSAAEIAAALGISVEAVHQRLSRGRQHIADEITEHVDRALEARRRRRRALVFAPVAFAPSRATAATRGWNMLKFGIPATIAAALGTAYVVEQSRAEPLPEITTTAKTPSPLFAGGLVPSPLNTGGFVPAQAGGFVPLPPRPTAAASANTAQPSTCAQAAKHLADLALEMAPIAPPSGDMAFGITQLERECIASAWSQSFIDCMAAAPDIFSTIVCRRGGPRVETQPNDNADISCAAVGRNVGGHVATLKAMIPADAHHAIDSMQGDLESSCLANDWPEPVRRCYATAASLAAIQQCHQ